MCGRIVRDRDFDAARFGIVEFSDTRVTPRFNIAPTQLDLFVRADGDERRLVPSRWGLIPGRAKDRSVGSKMFNARAETLTERPAFRPLVARHRCVIPASGFYEWQTTATGKQPLYIHAQDGASLALAGLWTVWTDPASGERVTSHTIITCAPNEFMGAIHNRMPVVLDAAALERWLDPSLTDAGAAQALLRPCPDGVLDAYPVPPLVNQVRNDGPELIQPVRS